MAIKQIADTATPLRELNPAVPEALAAITERAMAKEPRNVIPPLRPCWRTSTSSSATPV
ncbi:MAG: hypothetical protein ACLRZH_06740 [Ruthenibacterium lactatiformans]